MERRSQKLPSRLAAFLLGVAGVLLCLVLISALVGLMLPARAQVLPARAQVLPARAQDFLSLQVWPDHSIGVASGLLGDSTAHAATQVLPLGVCYTSEGDVVRARTYLRFPLDVFPPGTEILRATLYMYVDSGSSEGEATLGVYRAVEPWEDVAVGWGGDPATWPALLTLPLATTTVRFDVVTPTRPVSIVVPTATPVPTATVTPVPTATVTPTLFTSPLPTPTPFSPPTFPAPVVPLGQVTETWIAWDVTALMRAWLVGEVPNDGLVLASAPDPAAAPEMAGDLLVARWLAAADLDTRPHVIAEFEVHPVTPPPTYPPSPLSTPTSTPVLVLPSAGSAIGWNVVGLLFGGGVLLILGLLFGKSRSPD